MTSPITGQDEGVEGGELASREQVEAHIRALCMRGDYGQGVELAMRSYGPEIRRLMASVLHHPELAKDAFSLFSENLVKGLPGFRWESSFRTWAYRLARNACYHQIHAPAAREQPVSEPAANEPLRNRTDTHPWQRTAVKERFRALREQLEPHERMLLMLRVDQRLPWTEIARVMAEPDEPVNRAALNRRATALRQQFQRVKARLRALAVEQGVIPADHLDA
ncbi:sigma-70 family RNA polymerase sigma factor [Pyxidicoccus fallax]|uniref:Sigma-70 family RNA polymerase sigma factor n=1 Tax=Pyxidicoccus fallax TaxID=394095 RepID=A0A848LP77_9BACT|nr:sigma-70 family RNA polymerase sigma factor [Pyxidicoccus fallax]NMO19546.1 sigma-70 family RNA polymerase sigma factor [Pyxidicoccus fallax]NPC80249.1 sigma-70 family RNA polymerase sigma factor [Pyxidicoccus fallax]